MKSRESSSWPDELLVVDCARDIRYKLASRRPRQANNKVANWAGASGRSQCASLTSTTSTDADNLKQTAKVYLQLLRVVVVVVVVMFTVTITNKHSSYESPAASRRLGAKCQVQTRRLAQSTADRIASSVAANEFNWLFYSAISLGCPRGSQSIPIGGT